ncbi:hypothetical protein BXZ70DRAFT_1005179 [Cristinia sonorae]|uniref:TPR-like protein n=1 Tax=Cristinia sonorae TaxID=1940300 RepID=A0A8K0UVR3_9AGAR|nr:hypothetical protein BXZ70DRAFT_1005179 [Cristinia sonorae]
MPGNTQTPAEKLKAEGNALFVKKDYRAAHHKYSEAIKIDGNNAILYANRAACSQFLRKYLDATADAKKATTIDPTYAKGWARLAAAEALSGNETHSIESWKKAIGALPAENPSAAELKQKEQYESELKTVEAKLHELTVGPPPRSQTTRTPGSGSTSQAASTAGANYTPVSIPAGQAPWARAVAQIGQPQAAYEPPRGWREENTNSSAWVIAGAYEDWKQGEEFMNKQKVERGAVSGWKGAITAFSNAVVRDERVLHLPDSRWIDMYNRQVKLEAMQWGALLDRSTEEIKADALKRQRLRGWDASRGAINITIRAIMMRGVLESILTNRSEVAVQYIERALELLRWGHETWKDAHELDKGMIFSDSFVRGMHTLYVEAYMKACAADPRKFKLEKLLKEAQDLLKHCDTIDAVTPVADVGFQMSFTIYPRGTALSVSGFYHSEMARKLLAETPTAVEAILKHYHEAGDYYLSAADTLPSDDEKCLRAFDSYIFFSSRPKPLTPTSLAPGFLNCATENYFLCGAGLRIILPIMEKLRKALPKAKKIWGQSASFQVMSSGFDQSVKVEKDIRKKIAEGSLTLDSNRKCLKDGAVMFAAQSV